MAVQLNISESITSSLRLPEPEVQPRLRLELAVALYGQDILSFGKAVELSGVSRYELADIVTRREIPRHYNDQDLELDLSYARGF